MTVSKRALELGILTVAFGLFAWTTVGFYGKSSQTPEFAPPRLQQVSRTPAAAPASKPVVDPAYVPYELSCTALKQTTETHAGRIRLIGGACKDLKDDEVEIRNDTTGFAATVFKSKLTGAFSTDFIPLVSGKNQLKFQTLRGPASAQKSVRQIELTVERIRN